MSRKEPGTKIGAMCYKIMSAPSLFYFFVVFIEGQITYFDLYVIMVIELIRLNGFIQSHIVIVDFE